MQSVKVKKDWLREKVAKNRDGHRVQYEEAFAGYRAECIRVLEENLAAFKAGKRSRIVWSETPPEDHTNDYDVVIAMLDASVDDEVEIEWTEFQQYVQNDWRWMQAWTVSNSKYMGRR